VRQPSAHFKEIAQQYLKPDILYISSLIASATNQSEDSDSVHFASVSLVGLIETFGLHTDFIDTVTPTLQKEYKKNHRLCKAILNMTLYAANQKRDAL
jgi:hypothetical protein